ncbi:UDP-N-acetylmuramoylalanyl-D-glutamyl-2,6-diaminopimelate--D-alanyl-D-alanine ligase [Fodinicurvata sediminis]|uniref:UDP-N-acetylmuramoylalanyl-D-glutamyl-2, 6-diaminopimelate--D-alanyl-D-alanine ligase n=1 Tax=Fodinicurvata sediminis TaxID=1121832 RepID=UPI0003B48DB1|nr:UDP-N-acetylmuramoylalanyl-D-glutamyl-2,6-diaminopimelate--D-alanyl-D-alanine ligase [Fodinicurvata sediminis]
MASLWTAEAVRDAVNGQGEGDWSASGVSIDTRSLEPGDLFVALSGPNFDAHDFVAEAFSRGAAAAIVSRPLPAEGPLVVVDDTLQALTALGAAGRARASAKIVAVTGSSGKTSTKEMLIAALSAQGKTHGSAASHNNHWGVPLSLARLPQDAAYGVFEVGMNHSGEIRPLSRLIRPQVAVITNIGMAHLEHLGSQDAIAAAKAEIFEGLGTDGTAVLPRDSEYWDFLTKAARKAGVETIRSFGTDEAADLRLLDWAASERGGEVHVALEGREMTYHLGLPGRHQAMNSLAVLSAAQALGAEIDLAARAFDQLQAMPGRGARQEVRMPEGGSFTLLDECYNANPLSMAAALGVLGATQPATGGRRIAVLGDMLELGSDSQRFHEELAENVTANSIDLVFLAGPMMSHLAHRLPEGKLACNAETSADLPGPLLQELRPGDVVLVKGSLGSRMRVIVEALTASEADEAKQANGG